MPFHEDLKLGQKYEKKALEHLEYDTYKIMEGNFKPYDIRIWKNHELTKYEIKCDRLSIKTGNLAIEYECNNKPSGITSTEADNYLYFIIKPNDEYDLYNVPVGYLKNMCKDCRSVKGGDGYRSKMYLLKKEKLLNYLV